MKKKRGRPKKEVKKIPNPLAQYDPTEPEHIPEEFTEALNRSVYFSPEKAAILYQVQAMQGALGEGNVNEAIVEGLELWTLKHRQQYLKRAYLVCELGLRGLEERLASGKRLSKDEKADMLEMLYGILKAAHSHAIQREGPEEELADAAALKDLFKHLFRWCECRIDPKDFTQFLFHEWSELRYEMSDKRLTKHEQLTEFCKGFIDGVDKGDFVDRLRAAFKAVRKEDKNKESMNKKS